METWALLQEYLTKTTRYNPKLSEYNTIGSSVQIIYSNDYNDSISETLDILDYITFIYNKLNEETK